MVAVGPNMFYTVTLPCTLWFLDKGKANQTPSPMQGEGGDGGRSVEHPSRRDTILFIDARHIYRQIDRAHRDWADAQIGFIANIVRLYRGEAPDTTLGGEEAKAKLVEVFSPHPHPNLPPEEEGTIALSPSRGELERGWVSYRDIPGLCKAATLAEIEAQGWSLNPGRYVGVAAGEEVSDEDFKGKLESLNEELEVLNAQARELEQTIALNVSEILEA